MEKRIILTGVLLASASLGAFAPTNFFVPYDQNLKLPAASKKTPMRIGVNVEASSTSSAENWDGKDVNVLRINNADQAVIPMLINATNTSATQLLQGLTAAFFPAQPLDDGVRGHITMDGDFDAWDITVHGRYQYSPKWLPGNMGVGISLPIRRMEIDNVRFSDKTTSLTAGDLNLKRVLSDPTVIQSSVKALGLDIYSWNKTGAGDLVVTLDWSKDFAQDKSVLKNVELNAFIGVSCPTSDEKDEDKAFSIAMGNDGAWALPLGLGLDLDFKYHIAMGVAAQFDIIFDHSKIRRMKTETHQTEFLLLNKGDAEMEYGLTWRANVYLQGYHFWRGLSLKAAYEYTKHDSDELHPRGTTFSSAIVNTANSLKEWNTQNVIFMMNYDFFKECKKCCVKPQISLFYKLNCDGKRVIASDTFGGQFGLNF